MGAAQSWCCGVKGRDELLPGKRRPNGFKHNREVHVVGSRPVTSAPQPIKLQGPSYSTGRMEVKYEMLDEIGEDEKDNYSNDYKRSSVADVDERLLAGHGGTSVVYKCRDRRTGTIRACKIIDRRAVEREHNVLMEQFQVEIQVLQSLKHANIIHIEDVFLSESKICMITEYMSGGELFDYVVDRGTLSEVEASTIVRQITSAVAYLHARGIIHRDLKPENLMLTSKSRGAAVKIIDFGLAKLLDADDKTASFLGTRGYLAPEMLQRQAYSMSVDMWALGIIVYILLCGCLPFDDDGGKIANEKAARAKFGLRFPRWASGLSESAKDLLRNLLEVDSANRFTAEQALAHPWVTGARTPNKFLKSPNYLRSIKQEQVSQKMNGRIPLPNGNGVEVCNGNGNAISVRRQSR
ncbi:Calcium/calmodulin-dependent protein kinase type 1D [Phytophthora citrophthora]|uniref:Calcium/calmodulin-dependent protein kinase type 1D n=1 Tax=Phytophthora citrophthora TaxID=4793 RepID=A0AAD9G643_9STRA|nr:Calcium/calmodulin-dependent protein kinase type 1D [Phytophthora citrophthora]